MDTIVIMGPPSHSLDSVQAALSPQWNVESATRNALVLQERGIRVYLRKEDEFAAQIHMEGFCSTQLKELYQQMYEASFLLLDYTDVEFAKKVLAVIADDPRLVVDNAFGTVLPGDQFVARIRSDPKWNWKTSA